MNFDFIVGNPPYQAPNAINKETKKTRDTNGGATLFYQILQRLYDKFNCSMSMVTPAKIGSKKLLFSRGLKDYHLCGDVFDLGLEIATWRLVKEDNTLYDGPVTVYYSNFTETITEGPIFPENKKEVFTLYRKAQKHQKSVPNYGSLGEAAKKDMKLEKSKEFKYPVQVKMNSTVGKEAFMYSGSPFLGNLKMVMPMSQKLFPDTVLVTNNTFNNLFCCIDLTDFKEDEIQNLKNYCSSFELQIYAEFVAKSIGSLRYFFIPEAAKKVMTSTEIRDSLGWDEDDFKKAQNSISDGLVSFARNHKNTYFMI